MFLTEEELKKPSSVVLPEDEEPHGKIFVCLHLFYYYFYICGLHSILPSAILK